MTATKGKGFFASSLRMKVQSVIFTIQRKTNSPEGHKKQRDDQNNFTKTLQGAKEKRDKSPVSNKTRN